MRGSFRVALTPFTRFAVLVAWTIAFCPAPSFAQEGSDDEPFLLGLLASFHDEDGHSASRLDHQLAFPWGEGRPDPRLSSGEFHASWQGQLLVTKRGDYRFYLFGSGEMELKIAGRVAVARQVARNGWLKSPALALAADFQSIELSFRRKEKAARLMVLWSGPDFGMEPIPPHVLFHPRDKPVGRDFERGQLLAQVLRCGSCHADGPAPRLAPALDRLNGNVARGWLVRWLAAGDHARPVRADRPDEGEPLSPRRMPDFGFSNTQAEAVADWLLSSKERERSMPAAPLEEKPRKKAPKPDAKTGERLFLTLGCLACHTWGDFGASGWLGGGDLTHIAEKRPADFFSAWLTDPARLNSDHLMPIFSLSGDERTSLALFLAAQHSEESKPNFRAQGPAEHLAEGRKLVEQFQCAACHRLPGLQAESHPVPSLNDRSHWDRSCLDAPDPARHRPGYRLGKRDAQALRVYYTCRRPAGEDRATGRDGRLLLALHNCLACHVREGTREAIPLLPPLLSDKLTAVAKRYPDLAPLVPALTPPALNSAGDKLTDPALIEAIARRGEPHRPYLHVRMPRFALPDDELQAVVRYLIDTDRVPPGASSPIPVADRSRLDRYTLAGGRLVSSDGFGCTSCHQVGRVLPSNAPLNARGPELSRLDRRIRRPWFDRWVRDPARIEPRMEMPSVQVPVSGVLDGKIDDQLAAVWHVLNLPGFEPPLPNPIRTLRHSGNDTGAEAVVLTDLIQKGDKTRLKPFLIGLANRHNVLIDLEIGSLSLWTVGDVARQRTRGKTWLWELAGATVLETGIRAPDLTLLSGGREMLARPLGQFITEADEWKTEQASVVLQYRLQFDVPAPPGEKARSAVLKIQRKLAPIPLVPANSSSGFTEEISVRGVPAGACVRLHLMSPETVRKATCSADGRSVQLGDRYSSRIVLAEPAGARLASDGASLLLSPDEKGTVHTVLHYLSRIPLDRFPDVPAPPVAARKAEPVEVAPGFTGERLPLPPEIMPTCLTWRPNGRLVFSSLKGQVYEALDTDRDGSADQLRLVGDGLPAPYGVHAGPGYVDVSAKYAVLRLWDASATGRRTQAIASGWGYSADYHDWAVGLPRNERGEYYLGIPCQQDKRPSAAARFHGDVLRLLPRRPTAEDPRLYTLDPLSSGHRFPMGLALDRAGELFVTDNQGNYKPFNELNHVRRGAHFGFINYLDRGKAVPRRTPPAIDIPHPWTRSVNGICFLYTPHELRAKLGRDAFGPLEGHLIGCEYDTRRLIRMTLQRVGDTFQGAAYPLSIPPTDPQRGFLGPLVCAVSPRGELYVGSIRDSGWGAGNNVGEIVRVPVQPDKLPCGIAEVRATHDGFILDFFRPIDRELAGRAECYTIQSYRREPTPAYGGPDRDRRTEKVTGITVAPDARQVTLQLAEMRAGFVYELRLKNLAVDGGEFHPAEAHYTLRVIPK
jgi:mono/diheme cytochrome c family protein